MAPRQLSRRQRECLVLRYFLSFTEAEIAAQLGISGGSVKTHTARGLAAMAQLLGGRMNIEERLRRDFQFGREDLDLDAARRVIGERVSGGRRGRPWWVRAAWLIPLLALIRIGIPLAESLAPAGHQRHVETRPSSRPEVVSVPLPAGNWFSQIAAGNGALVLSGSGPGSGPSHAISSSAQMNPETLQLFTDGVADCPVPALAGQTVAPTSTESASGGSVSIAVEDPSGRISVGPTVMTYPEVSDERPVSAYGGGLLWLYDVGTPSGPEVLEISGSSGAVLRRVAMPRLFRPVMAAGDDGLWIGNSVNGAGGMPAFYHLSPGAAAATVVIPNTDLVSCWLVADGAHVWAGMGAQDGCLQETIWRFDAGRATPVFEVPDAGYEPLVVVGGEAGGLWTVQWADRADPQGSETQKVIRIDPDTGAETVITTLPATSVPTTMVSGLNDEEAVVLHGSLYLMEPPFQHEGYLGYTSLVRVTPAH